jgi:hypothetical protein
MQKLNKSSTIVLRTVSERTGENDTFIDHSAAGHVGDRAETVVDVQRGNLRLANLLKDNHHEESPCIDESNQGRDGITIPTLMFVV